MIQWKKPGLVRAILYCLTAIIVVFSIWLAIYGRNRDAVEIYTLSGTDFLLPGEKIFVGNKSDIDFPSQQYDNFYFSSGQGIFRRITQVNGPESLIDRVHLTSPEMALRYARLFTSPTQFARVLLPGDTWGEVVALASLDESYFFGNKLMLDGIRSHAGELEKEQGSAGNNTETGKSRKMNLSHIAITSYDGILSDVAWKRNQLPFPVIKKVGEDYIVQRALFRIPNDGRQMTNEVYWVEEKISPKGALNRRILEKVTMKDKITFFIMKQLK